MAHLRRHLLFLYVIAAVLLLFVLTSCAASEGTLPQTEQPTALDAGGNVFAGDVAGDSHEGASGGSDSDSSFDPYLACIDREGCIVDLRGCTGEGEKHPLWENYTLLGGRLLVASYENTSGILCDVNLNGHHQLWPLKNDPKWWCGEVLICDELPGFPDLHVEYKNNADHDVTFFTYINFTKKSSVVVASGAVAVESFAVPSAAFPFEVSVDDIVSQGATVFPEAGLNIRVSFDGTHVFVAQEE